MSVVTTRTVIRMLAAEANEFEQEHKKSTNNNSHRGSDPGGFGGAGMAS